MDKETLRLFLTYGLIIVGFSCMIWMAFLTTEREKYRKKYTKGYWDLKSGRREATRVMMAKHPVVFLLILLTLIFFVATFLINMK